MVGAFTKDLNMALGKCPSGEWTTVSISELCRGDIAKSAVDSLFSPSLTKLTPDFMDRFWDFDKHVLIWSYAFPDGWTRGHSKPTIAKSLLYRFGLVRHRTGSTGKAQRRRQTGSLVSAGARPVSW